MHPKIKWRLARSRRCLTARLLAFACRTHIDRKGPELSLKTQHIASMVEDLAMYHDSHSNRDSMAIVGTKTIAVLCLRSS